MIERRRYVKTNILNLLLVGLIMFNACRGNSSDPGMQPDELKITSIFPESGPVGTEITISGSGFSSLASENSIMFKGGVTAEVQQASITELVTEVPEGAKSGAIRIEVDEKTVSTATFKLTRTGVLKIISVTSGENPNNDGYTATLDAGEQTGELAPNDTLVWEKIPTGSHDLELSGLANNCSADGANPRMLEVSPDDTTTIKFRIGCTRMRRIAFESQLDIWIMREDGRKLENLTDSPAKDRFYQWSPDGTKIAFESDQTGNPDIWIMEADGSNLKQLTNHAGSDIRLTWSPDGTKIAFMSDRTSFYPEIWVMHTDGTGKVNLTPGDGAHYNPKWSPDGSKIAYTKNNDIWVMDADGSDQTPLTTDPGYDDLPAWSPDGTQIAFSSERSDEGEFDLWVMRYDGTSKTKLTSADGYDGPSYWSPDGSLIAFRSMRSGDNEIWVINSDGSNETRLHFGEHPNWSPDGSRIVFMKPCSPYYNIWSINVNGTDPVRHTKRMNTDSYPKWQPDAQ